MGTKAATFDPQWLSLPFMFLQFHWLLLNKQALKSDWLGKGVTRAENSAIRELIVLLRANQTAKITSDF